MNELAKQIVERQNQVNEAVKKSSNAFLFRILNNAREFDSDIVLAASKEWEVRKGN